MRTNRRRKFIPPFVIGLTGSIGMGKSTVARLFARMGVAVCNSDEIVHRLLSGKAIARIVKLFPAVVADGVVDRKALGREVFADNNKRKALEAILHPLVREEQDKFIRRMRNRGIAAVLLDIPLLFETRAELRCDKVVVVDAPLFIQRRRVLLRAGMTEERFQAILALQMPAAHKRARADAVIHTGLGKARSMRQVREFLNRCGSSTR